MSVFAGARSGEIHLGFLRVYHLKNAILRPVTHLVVQKIEMREVLQ